MFKKNESKTRKQFLKKKTFKTFKTLKQEEKDLKKTMDN